MDKKKNIILSFMELAKEAGSMNEVTIKEVAIKAGIGKGTVYEYFSSKEEIIVSVIDFVIGMMMDLYLIDDGYEELGFNDSLRKYIANAYEASKSASQIMTLQHDQIANNVKMQEIKDIVFKKIADFQNENLKIFKDNIYKKGLLESLVSETNDEYLRIVLRLIVREFQDKTHMQDDLIDTERLQEYLYVMTIKLLKAE